ncbi:MAG: hypothetical protein GY943_03285 [Chloroflexi bacterium]|nr:hypothetical protein [Chloroflexota bacterium]
MENTATLNRNWLIKILEVPVEDPDQRRRSKLLNIMLLGVLILTLIGIIVVAPQAFQENVAGEIVVALWAMFFTLCLIGVAYGINYYISADLSSSLFLGFLAVVIYLSNTPYEAMWGQNMIMVAVPIIMASVLLRPYASFIAATLVAIGLTIVANLESIDLNVFGLLAYFLIAFVSWLSSNTLEKTLKNLRILNEELDQRVANRTSQLQIANTELRQARDKAVEANQYKTQLTARVSHELRTPLGSILGFTEMLRSGHYGEVNPKQQERLSKVVGITQHLAELINDWLDQAQLESGKLKIIPGIFSARELAAQVDDTMTVLAQKKRLTLHCHVEKKVPLHIFADKDRIQQILINLLANAIKYTDKGSVDIRYYVDQDYWGFDVKDTGCGIVPETLPLIFESFQQADGSTTRKYEGFGLGLSIVQQLVNLMDGEISVESEIDQGSTFTVKLPLLPLPDGIDG